MLGACVWKMLTCKIHKKHQVEKRDHVRTCNDNFIYKNILIMEGGGSWRMDILCNENISKRPGLRGVKERGAASCGFKCD